MRSITDVRRNGEFFPFLPDMEPLSEPFSVSSYELMLYATDLDVVIVDEYKFLDFSCSDE